MHLGASPEALDALCAQAIEHEIPPVWVRAAADELDRHDELLAPLTPRLLHGDLSMPLLIFHVHITTSTAWLPSNGSSRATSESLTSDLRRHFASASGASGSTSR